MKIIQKTLKILFWILVIKINIDTVLMGFSQLHSFEMYKTPNAWFSLLVLFPLICMIGFQFIWEKKSKIPDFIRSLSFVITSIILYIFSFVNGIWLIKISDAINIEITGIFFLAPMTFLLLIVWGTKIYVDKKEYQVRHKEEHTLYDEIINNSFSNLASWTRATQNSSTNPEDKFATLFNEYMQKRWFNGVEIKDPFLQNELLFIGELEKKWNEYPHERLRILKHARQKWKEVKKYMKTSFPEKKIPQKEIKKALKEIKTAKNTIKAKRRWE